MKKVLTAVFLFVLVLMWSGSGLGAPAAPQAAGGFVPDEVLVKFEPGADPGATARAVGARLHDRIPALDVYVLKVPAGAVEGTVLALSHNTQVEYAEPNGIATAFVVPNDTYVTSYYPSSHSGNVLQWAWAKVQAYAAWDITTGTGVRVAVVDTGIDNSNPELPAVVAQKDFINNDSNAEDDNGHGTHVAGTIGALTNNGEGVAGANWSVSLLAAKVLNASGSGSYSAVANGITWAADNGAKAINLSLGGYLPSSTLKSAVDYAWKKGAVLACAAGNDGMNWKLYPAAYANCIAVAATDENDNKASFSNYGSWVDVAGPGVRILSTMPNSTVYLNTQYGYYQNFDVLNGTSMATPHVAGLAGLVWASGICGTPGSASCVRNRIESTADKIAGTGTYWKWGRVNYLKAVSP